MILLCVSCNFHSTDPGSESTGIIRTSLSSSLEFLSSSIDYDDLPSLTVVDVTSSSGIVLSRAHASTSFLSASHAPPLDLSVLSSETSASFNLHSSTDALDTSSLKDSKLSSFNSAYVLNNTATYIFPSEYINNPDVQLGTSAIYSTHISLALSSLSFASSNINNNSFLSEFVTTNRNGEYTAIQSPSNRIEATKSVFADGNIFSSSRQHSRQSERVGLVYSTVPTSTLSFGQLDDKNPETAIPIHPMKSPTLALDSSFRLDGLDAAPTAVFHQNAHFTLSTKFTHSNSLFAQKSDQVSSSDFNQGINDPVFVEEAPTATQGLKLYDTESATTTFRRDVPGPLHVDIIGDGKLDDILEDILSERQGSTSQSKGIDDVH